MTKRCSKCSRRKAVDAFYARSNKCKSCTKAAVRANYRRNRDHYVAYDKKREQRPERKAFKSDAQKRYIAKNPGKRKARIRLNNAVRDGRVIRQPCMGCGSTNAQAHHPDYRKPFAVAWLCKNCHWQQHGSVSEGAASPMTTEIFRCVNAEGDRLVVSRVAGSLCLCVTDDVTAAIALTQEQEQQMLLALAPDLRERTRALMQALDEAAESPEVNQLRAMLYAHLQPHAARLGLAGVL